MEPFFFFGGRQGDPVQPTAPDIRRRQKAADAATTVGTSTAPVEGGTVEALARMLTGSIGGYMAGQANQAEKAGQAQVNAQFQQATGGGSDPWNGLRQTPGAAQAPGAAGTPAVNTSPSPGFGGFTNFRRFLGGR